MAKRNDTDLYMSNRTLQVLSAEMRNMLENLNTWSVSLKELIKIKRTLLKSPTADSELYDIMDVYSELYYAEYSKTSNAPTGTRKIVKHKPRRNSNDKSDTDIDVDVEVTDGEHSDVDVDDFLQKVIKEEQRSRVSRDKPAGAPLTETQKAALRVLDTADQEGKKMDALINARRAQMERDMSNPPVKPVNFTVTDCDIKEPAKPSESNSDSDGEVLEEVVIEEAPQSNLENELKTVMSNITADTTMHPLVAMQKENSIFNEPPAVKFTTPDPPEFDPKYGPLFSLTAPQRKKLFYQWFKRATVSVDEQLANNPVSPNTRNRLIREETTRLQDTYLESR